jgi:hypothetical protein
LQLRQLAAGGPLCGEGLLSHFLIINSVSDYVEIQTPLKGYYVLVERECRMSGADSVDVGFSFRAAFAA